MEKHLERAKSPESVGIDSQAILGFIDECEKKDLELHSFMLLRHGKVAAEGWWKPFNPQIPHTMFSFSKSVSSTAIGFAIDEGKLSVNTKVYDIFPEYSPKIRRKWQDLLTVEHLLTMTSGKMPSFMYNTEKVGWVQSFLRAPFINMPGEKFEYATENSFMLSAIIKKVTGQNIVEYLTPRLFEPLSIDVPFWEMNRSGTEVGGWGLYLKTEDQAKFVQCYLNNGKWEGKQVIPEFWTKTVGEKHIDKTPGVSVDHSVGYGYQFWLNQIPNSYRCDGVFSQLGIVLKDYEACFVTNGGEPIEANVLEAFWSHFPKGFHEEPLPENPEALAALKVKLESLSLPCLPEMPRREWLENKISGKLIKFRKTMLASVLGTAENIIRAQKSGGFNNVRFTFEKDFLRFFWTEKYNENEIEVGYNGEYRISKADFSGSLFTFASSCTWMDDGSLEIWIRPLEHAQVRKLNFTFDGQNVKLKSRAEKGLYDLALFGLDFKGFRADELFRKITKGATDVVEPIVDPDLNGRFVEQIFEKKA